MKNCFRKCCCAVFCCTCCQQTPLNVINNETILLPKNEATKDELETERLYIYGSVPPELKSVLMEDNNHERNKVKKIVCGKYHSIILLRNNRILGFGLNEMGQLGLPLETKEVTHMTELNINIPNVNLGNFQILDIAAGDDFSLILIETEDHQRKIINFGVSILNRYAPMPNTQTQKIEIIPNEVNSNINKIVAFEKRKIFCTKTNEIYLGGRDFFGTELDEYILLKKFEKKIENIFLQKESCIVQDSEGEIWGLTDNSYKEFGFGPGFTNDFYPFKFKFKKDRIKKICAGARHLLILLENGELFSLGDNSDGQCGGSNSTCGFPNKIEINKGKIVDCYAGYNHNLAIVEFDIEGEEEKSYRVYTWGNTDNGKLGYYEDKISQDTPREIFWMKIRCINYICLGYQISIIVTGRKEDSIPFKEQQRIEPPLIIAH